MAEMDKVTIMVLNVDIKCSKCYKKVKKLLCKFPEIRDQKYDEKANKVTIKVVCCSPEKIRDKLCCKGGGSIKSIEIKDDVLKPVTTMVLNVVDLQCLKCYKKVKKFLCKFPEIRDQKYDEKANKVTITVVGSWPEKIRDKLCSKGGGIIKSIEIKKPDEKKPSPPAERPRVKLAEPNGDNGDIRYPPPPAERPRVKHAEPNGDNGDIRYPPPPAERPRLKPAEPNGDNGDIRYPPQGTLPYPPPASLVIGFWWGESSSHSGIPGNPCYRGGPVHYVGCYGRPIYDSWGGGCCDYFREENQQSCSIM